MYDLLYNKYLIIIVKLSVKFMEQLVEFSADAIPRTNEKLRLCWRSHYQGEWKVIKKRFENKKRLLKNMVYWCIYGKNEGMRLTHLLLQPI